MNHDRVKAVIEAVRSAWPTTGPGTLVFAGDVVIHEAARPPCRDCPGAAGAGGEPSDGAPEE